MKRNKIFNNKCVLKHKHVCTKCGKTYFAYNMYSNSVVVKIMEQKQVCWECAYWENFIMTPPDHLEVIGNRCYQIFPYVEKTDVFQILGGGGETGYFLKKDGTCAPVNDVWWINVIPWQYQQQFQPTGWWVTRNFYRKYMRMRKPCTAKGCLDRYHCYRYQYQQEFGKEPYNIVPKDWVVGDERCPAFLPLSEIKGYDEYVKPSDIIDEDSVALKLDNYGLFQRLDENQVQNRASV